MDRALTLETVHHERGAEFVVAMGCRVPGRFGDPESEYEHVRCRAGVIDRSYRGVVSVSGPEAPQFLERLLSSEVEELAVGEGRIACLLTPKGKVLAAFRVFRSGETQYRLLLPEPVDENFLETLLKYAFLGDVEVADVSAESCLFTVEGPRASEVIAEVFGISPAPLEAVEEGEEGEDGSPGSLRLTAVEWESRRVAIYPGGESPEGGHDVEMPVEVARPAWDALIGAAAARGGGPVGHGAAEILRVEAGIPRLGVDFTRENLPGEAGFEGALTYSKCYVGQEVVARMRTYGHANRLLRGLRFSGDGTPRPGDTLRGEESARVGRVTSVAKSPRCGVIALAMIHRSHWSPETRLVAESGASVLECVVTGLPFVQPRGTD